MADVYFHKNTPIPSEEPHSSHSSVSVRRFETVMTAQICFPSGKGPSLRQLSRQGPELEMPLLHLNEHEGENSAADEDEEEEVFLH